MNYLSNEEIIEKLIKLIDEYELIIDNFNKNNDENNISNFSKQISRKRYEINELYNKLE